MLRSLTSSDFLSCYSLSDGTRTQIPGIGPNSCSWSKTRYVPVLVREIEGFANVWGWPVMTLELKILALSIVLGLVQVVLASHAASMQRGYVWTASSRDEAAPRLTGIAGRLGRAPDNFAETFPLFAAAVLTAHLAGIHSWMTEWGVQLYFWARIAYVALYAAGGFLPMPLLAQNRHAEKRNQCRYRR